MTTSERTHRYPKLGDIHSGRVSPVGGCCDDGPSYSCHTCGQTYCERTSAAREATEYFARWYPDWYGVARPASKRR